MKKLLLLFIAISIFECGEKEEKIINVDDITIVNKIAYNKHDMTLVTGKVRKWHENGQLMRDWQYKDGIANGVSKEWHENGQLRVETTYKDGKKDGVSKMWFENGQLRSE